MSASPLPRRELDFTDAMQEVAVGKCVSRRAWRNPLIYYFIDINAADDKDRSLKAHWADGQTTEVVLHLSDILADDFVIVEPETVQ